MVRQLVFVSFGILALAVAVPAAESLKNPDVPFGLCAVDLYGGRATSRGPFGGDLEAFEFGAMLALPFSPRSTMFLGVDRHVQEDQFTDVVESSGATMLSVRMRFYLGN